MPNLFKLTQLLLLSDSNNNLQVDVNNPKKINIIWLEVSFGELVSSRGYFLALKKKYPSAAVTLVVNKNVKLKLKQSKLTFKRFFDYIHSPSEIITLFRIVRNKAEITIVPTLGKFYYLNYFILWLTNSLKKYGLSKFNNDSNFFRIFIKDKILVNILRTPDIHITQILFEQLKKINEFEEPENFVLNFNLLEEKYIREMKRNFGFYPQRKIVVINLFTEKAQNRFSTLKFLELINLFTSLKNIQLCIIDDKHKTNFKKIENNINMEVLFFPNNDMKNLFNLLNFVDLAITCDSEFMHIAGVLSVPQISLFGLTNPFVYAPIGKNKIFIKKSELIEDIKAEDIFEKSKKFIEER